VPLENGFPLAALGILARETRAAVIDAGTGERS